MHLQFTLIVGRIDDGNNSGRLLLAVDIGNSSSSYSCGRTCETGTRAAASIVNALTQRLQPIHMHHCRRHGDDYAHNGAH